MTFEVDSWVLLPDGGVGRVAKRTDTPNGPQLTVETPRGRTLERPESYAAIYWQPVLESGLGVQRALDPDGVRRRATRAPVEVIIGALQDLGGEATTAQLQTYLAPDPVPKNQFAHWWRKVQPTLERDGRVDTSRARERRYRLGLEEQRTRHRRAERLSDETRGGRRLADGVLLRSARKLARMKAPVSAQDRAELRAESLLALDKGLDPTDRFMAAELGMWAGEWSEQEAAGYLADDVLLVDLLRISQHDSRDRAFDWAERWLAEDRHTVTPESPLLRSAAAAGDRWGERALTIASKLNLPVEAIVRSTVTWSLPGSEESGPPKYPADLETYRRRLVKFSQIGDHLDSAAARGLALGLLWALDRLPQREAHREQRQRTLDHTAGLFWAVQSLVTASERPALEDDGPHSADAWNALVRTAPDAMLAAVRGGVEAVFSRSPGVMGDALRSLATRLGTDPGSLALAAIQRCLQESRIPDMAAQALKLTGDIDESEEITALAVTVAPDNPIVQPAVRRLADATAARIVAGERPQFERIAFTRDAWSRLVGAVSQRVADLERRADAAEAAGQNLRQEVALLETTAERYREALAELRTEVASSARGSSFRMSAGVLRPVASALADSYEGQSLDALRDRLIAALRRAHIEVAITAGEVQRFDPDYHRWVGEGNPTELVLALSPSLIARMEGEDEIVVVPARVVAGS